jgi:hypothetical protein
MHLPRDLIDSKIDALGSVLPALLVLRYRPTAATNAPKSS